MGHLQWHAGTGIHLLLTLAFWILSETRGKLKANYVFFGSAQSNRATVCSESVRPSGIGNGVIKMRIHQCHFTGLVNYATVRRCAERVRQLYILLWFVLLL